MLGGGRGLCDACVVALLPLGSSVVRLSRVAMFRSFDGGCLPSSCHTAFRLLRRASRCPPWDGVLVAWSGDARDG